MGDDEDEENRVDRANLAVLSVELSYQKEDLHCFVPARQLAHKMKDIPLQSQESIRAKT